MVSQVKQNIYNKLWEFQLLKPLEAPSFTLRDYQSQAVKEVESQWMDQIRRVVMIAPTGSGKGTMIGQMVRDATLRGQRVIVVVTMLSLIPQAVGDCWDFGLKGNIGVVCGSFPKLANPNAPIQVVTLQTLQNCQYKNNFLSDADLVIFDEFHTSGFYEQATAILTEWHCWIAAFTATPYDKSFGNSEKYGGISRADGVVFCPDYLTLQKMGFLVPLSYSTLSLEVGKNKRDLNSDEGIRYVFETFLQSEGVRKEGHSRTFVFCQPASKGDSQVERVLRISQSFGLKFVVIDDTVQIKLRQKLLEQVDKGEIDGLICVRALAVGVDIKSLRHVIMLNKFGETNLYVQVAGRVARTHAESSKTKGYVHDYAGNVDIGDGSGLYPPIEVLSKEIVGDRFRVLSDSRMSEGDAPMKECTRCGNEVLSFVVECPYCKEVLCEPKELVDLNEGKMLTLDDLSWLI